MGDIVGGGEPGGCGLMLASGWGMSGFGGSISPYGMGGRGLATNSAGTDGSGYGSGGAGGFSNDGVNRVGGDGTSGIVIVEEYYIP
jgi:hypothetical protein